MQTEIQGIHAISPPRWRSLDGIVGVHWEAEGHAGASGYYLSPDPRIMLFFKEVSSHIRVSDQSSRFDRFERGLASAVYVPAACRYGRSLRGVIVFRTLICTCTRIA